ncbi:hypothetical protein PMAYCL1PPCAC_05391, partial [Pristionchus mayeri]
SLHPRKRSSHSLIDDHFPQSPLGIQMNRLSSDHLRDLANEQDSERTGSENGHSAHCRAADRPAKGAAEALGVSDPSLVLSHVLRRAAKLGIVRIEV